MNCNGEIININLKRLLISSVCCVIFTRLTSFDLLALGTKQEEKKYWQEYKISLDTSDLSSLYACTLLRIRLSEHRAVIKPLCFYKEGGIPASTAFTVILCQPAVSRSKILPSVMAPVSGLIRKIISWSEVGSMENLEHRM